MMPTATTASFIFNDQCVFDLEKCFQKGPIIEYQGNETRYVTEGKIDCIDGLVVFIYSNEHPPPHFHVKYNGEENSFNLTDGSPLHPKNGLKKYFRNINKWYTKNRATLVSAWNNNRPSNCPIGRIN